MKKQLTIPPKPPVVGATLSDEVWLLYEVQAQYFGCSVEDYLEALAVVLQESLFHNEPNEPAPIATE